MADYKVSYNGDKTIKNVHHIGVDYNGNYYSVIFGEYVNGGFCCIPNWNIACELAEFDDLQWNEESLNGVLKNNKAAKVIVSAIAEFIKGVR